MHVNGIVTDAVRDVTKHGALKCHCEKNMFKPMAAVFIFSWRPLNLILGDSPLSLGLVLLHTGTTAELILLL